jgi:hypothetical protein
MHRRPPDPALGTIAYEVLRSTRTAIDSARYSSAVSKRSNAVAGSSLEVRIPLMRYMGITLSVLILPTDSEYEGFWQQYHSLGLASSARRMTALDCFYPVKRHVPARNVSNIKVNFRHPMKNHSDNSLHY